MNRYVIFVLLCIFSMYVGQQRAIFRPKRTRDRNVERSVINSQFVYTATWSRVHTYNQCHHCQNEELNVFVLEIERIHVSQTGMWRCGTMLKIVHSFRYFLCRGRRKRLRDYIRRSRNWMSIYCIAVTRVDRSIFITQRRLASELAVT